MNERHFYVDRLCTLLARVIVGRDAEAARETAEDGPELQHLAVLPVWGWAVSKIDVGRKDRVPGSDERLLLPVRLTWSTTSVVVLPAGSEALNVTWTKAGMGHTGRGVSAIDPHAGEGADFPDGDPTPPKTFGAAEHRRQDVLDRLDELAEDGRLAYFEALALVEEKVERALSVATSSLSAEVVHDSRARVLDRVSMDVVRTRMVLGDGNRTPTVMRLIEKCLLPTTFTRCDPEHYVLRAIKRDAVQEVRREIGDPQIGTKIRTVAEEMKVNGDLPTLDALVAEYRNRYPADRLSHTRAAAAMAVRPSPNASHFRIDDLDIDAQVVSAEEVALARLARTTSVNDDEDGQPELAIAS